MSSEFAVFVHKLTQGLLNVSLELTTILKLSQFPLCTFCVTVHAKKQSLLFCTASQGMNKSAGCQRGMGFVSSAVQ